MNTGTGAPAKTGRGDRGFREPSGAARRVGDERLVAAVRDGDERSFELLFERYRTPIGAYVASLVRDHGYSEDITQEVFISALRSLRERDQPVMFKPWIYEIARNACIDRHRRNRRREELAIGAGSALEADPSHLVAARTAPEVVIDVRARFAELCKTLMEMPAIDRKLLVMREFEGRSYREIVDRSGLSAPAVESALFRARKRLIERTAEQVGPPTPAATTPPPQVLRAGRRSRRAINQRRPQAHASVAGVSSSP